MWGRLRVAAHLQCHRRVRAFCHSSSPPSRHHRPTPSSGSVGVQPTPLRDVVGAEPVTDQASAPGVGGLTQGVSGLGGSGSRPHTGSLRLPRSDRTADSGPSRDVIQSPVDHQEVREDGELPDGEESGQDDEEWRDYAPPLFLHDDSRAGNDRLLEVFCSYLLDFAEFPPTLVRHQPHEEVGQRSGA